VTAHAAGGAIMALALACVGCNDLDRFSTGNNEAYCGRITLGSAFREGFSPRVQLRLELDAANLDGPESPGRLSTYEAEDEATPERRILTNAALSVIQPLQHDPMSQLSFGEGRERNVVYGLQPDDDEAESVLAVLSMRADDSVEVRLIRAGRSPSGDAATNDDVPEGRRRLFGLFPLTRKNGDCGF